MEPRAFVIMPFSSDFLPVWENVVRPALDGYEIARADSRLDERGILEKIITGIDEAHLVVADITSANANVMYELGVAHALGKPTIMIAQTVTGLPFDIRSYPVHEYAVPSAARAVTASQLARLAARHREGLVRFSNPVTDFLPRLGEVVTSVGAIRKRNEADVAREIGERASEISWAADAIGQFFRDFSSLGINYGSALAAVTARIGTNRRASSGAGDLGIQEASSLTRQFAVELNELSDRFRHIWERVGRALLWLVSPDQRAYITVEKATVFAEGVKNWNQHLDDTLAELAELRRINNSFPDVSGNLTYALETANSSITRHLNEIMTAKAYIARIATTPIESA